MNAQHRHARHACRECHQQRASQPASVLAQRHGITEQAVRNWKKSKQQLRDASVCFHAVVQDVGVASALGLRATM